MKPDGLPIARFPALSPLACCVHGFVGRAPGIGMDCDKDEALARLAGVHAACVADVAPGAVLVTAEQVHGAEVAVVVDAPDSDHRLPGVDGIVTNLPGVCLGIHVADCCAVYLVDPVRRAIGLVHAGKKGSELAIVPAAIARMEAAFGTRPAGLVVQLSPCIRPPRYEVDFAAEIRAQCAALGVREIHDCGDCTGADLRRYYSYRIEIGRTGRMLALLAIAGP